jgi:hypothetical protein
MVESFRRLPAQPDPRDLSIEASRTSPGRRQLRQLIQSKTPLRRLYDEWYRMILSCVPDGPGRHVRIRIRAWFRFAEEALGNAGLCVDFGVITPDAQAEAYV